MVLCLLKKNHTNNTNKQFECYISITPKHVFNEIKK